MRILLRDKIKGLYLEGQDVWTNDAGLAFDFKFIDRALKYAKAWGLREVELAFFWDNPLEVQTVPLERAALRCSA